MRLLGGFVSMAVVLIPEPRIILGKMNVTETEAPRSNFDVNRNYINKNELRLWRRT